MDTLFIEETSSTNTWLSEHENNLQTPFLVWCHTQLAGRGQRGNSWESEPGKNFTGSLLWNPDDFPASSQFLISEAVALAIVETLADFNIEAKVKWPNDIYVGDKKICGILFENAVTGRYITRSIAGIGLNVNQEVFRSDAPNPVSMKMITGKEYNLDEVVKHIATHLNTNISLLNPLFSFHKKFLGKLWRNDSRFYPFYDKKEERHIAARIMDIASDGVLSLCLSDGSIRRYAFKEVEFILHPSSR